MDSANIRDLSLAEIDTKTLLHAANEQAIQRRYEDFLIVDVDGHHMETQSYKEICEYIEDPVMRDQAKYQGFGAGGITSATAGGGYQNLLGRVTRKTGGFANEKTPADTHRDITLTKRWMDAIGIDQVCLFPTPMLTLGLTPRPEVENALARAYNRWLVENVLAHEPRITSTLYLPLNDPDATYKMVKEFIGKKGVIGFTIVSPRYKAVYDNAYMKTYAADGRSRPAAGVPRRLCLGRRSKPPALQSLHGGARARLLVVQYPSLHELAGERDAGALPKLKVAWIESGLAWVPFLMQRLDNEWMMRSSEVPLLKRRPSDYMREMFYSSQPMEMVNNREALELTFKMINAKSQLMYASDYPHWDMDLPSTIYDLPFLSEQGKRNILGGNAKRFFNLEPIMSPVKAQRLAARSAAE